MTDCKTRIVNRENFMASIHIVLFFFFQAEDGIRDVAVTGVQTCALPISCSYTIPTGSDPRLVNVEITVGSGMPMKIGKVDNAGACPASGGWYYDNNMTPKIGRAHV